jgi:hypothetical protein
MKKLEVWFENGFDMAKLTGILEQLILNNAKFTVYEEKDVPPVPYGHNCSELTNLDAKVAKLDQIRNSACGHYCDTVKPIQSGAYNINSYPTIFDL